MIVCTWVATAKVKLSGGLSGHDREGYADHIHRSPGPS